MKLRQAFKKIFRKMGYSVSVYSEYDIDSDHEFIDIYTKCKPYTMVARERCYALYNAVKYIVRNKVQGDFVECGVWKGGSSMIIAYTLQSVGEISRTIWLYDTYEGMSEPTEHDVFSLNGVKATHKWSENDKTDKFWCESSLEEVRNNMNLTNYPADNIRFVKGKVEDTIPAEMPSQISLLRLDTDWYESTLHELNHLYPVLSRGGALVLDDYGSWDGARKAVDEYVARDGVMILLNKTHNGRIGVKM